jgi:hypothetical protein
MADVEKSPVRRVRRSGLNVVAAVSAVLFVAAALMWVRGEFAWDELAGTAWIGSGARAPVWQVYVHGPRGKLDVMAGRVTYDFSDPAVEARFRQERGRYGRVRHASRGAQGEGLRLAGGLAGWGFRWETMAIDDPRQLRGPAPYRALALWDIEVAVPWWFLMLVFAVAPARWARRRRRERREGVEGRCRGCGYDLRATPERCPECGLEPGSGSRARSGNGVIRDEG